MLSLGNCVQGRERTHGISTAMVFPVPVRILCRLTMGNR
jgi:hypothetical protein